MTAQGGILCLISQAVNALGRTVLALRIARDEVALKDTLAVLIEPELLIRQADFDVRRAPVLIAVDRSNLGVDWFADRALLLGQEV